MELQCVSIGGATFRYLNVDKAAEHLVPLTVPQADADERYLFVGCDILLALKINPDLQPRFHIKYVKKGVATKVLLPRDLKLRAMKNTRQGLWCYSIRGLFQLLFEHGAQEMQLALLNSHLLEKWKISCSEAPLKAETQLSQPSDTLESVIQLSEVEVVTETTPVSSDPCKSSEKIREGEETVDHDNCMPTFLERFSVLLQETCACVKRHVLIRNLSTMLDASSLILQFFCETFDRYSRILNDSASLERYETDFGLPALDHLFLTLMCDWLGLVFHRMENTVQEKVNEFKAEHIHCIDDLPPSEEIVSRLFPLPMSVLISNWIGLPKFGGSELNPCTVVQQTTYSSESVIHSQASSKEVSEPDSLSESSKRFIKTNTVSQNVGEKDHIQPEHCYPSDNTSQLTKRLKTSDTDKMPFVQIILEFLNNSLISGVAHVVYTRLLFS